MPQKPRKGGAHKTPRIPVQLPEDWMKVARQLAATHKQPTTWFLIWLIAEEAKRQKKTHPKFPWDDDGA